MEGFVDPIASEWFMDFTNPNDRHLVCLFSASILLLYRLIGTVGCKRKTCTFAVSVHGTVRVLCTDASLRACNRDRPHRPPFDRNNTPSTLLPVFSKGFTASFTTPITGTPEVYKAKFSIELGFCGPEDFHSAYDKCYWPTKSQLVWKCVTTTTTMYVYVCYPVPKIGFLPVCTVLGFSRDINVSLPVSL